MEEQVMLELVQRAAEKWAAEHPDYAGLLQIDAPHPEPETNPVSNTLSVAMVWVRHGQVAYSAFDRSRGSFSGICDVCSKVYLEPVLIFAHTRDPQAGQPLTEGELNWEFYSDFPYDPAEHPYVHDEWSVAFKACPACLTANQFRPQGNEPFRYTYLRDDGVVNVRLFRAYPYTVMPSAILLLPALPGWEK